MKRITVQLHLANEKNLSVLIIMHLSSVLEKYLPKQTKTERLERFDSTRVLITSNWPTEPLTIGMFSLITRRSSVAGCYSGTAMDSQDTLEFSRLAAVHPMMENYP